MLLRVKGRQRGREGEASRRHLPRSVVMATISSCLLGHVHFTHTACHALAHTHTHTHSIIIPSRLISVFSQLITPAALQLTSAGPSQVESCEVATSASEEH